MTSLFDTPQEQDITFKQRTAAKQLVLAKNQILKQTGNWLQNSQTKEEFIERLAFIDEELNSVTSRKLINLSDGKAKLARALLNEWELTLHNLHKQQKHDKKTAGEYGDTAPHQEAWNEKAKKHDEVAANCPQCQKAEGGICKKHRFDRQTDWATSPASESYWSSSKNSSSQSRQDVMNSPVAQHLIKSHGWQGSDTDDSPEALEYHHQSLYPSCKASSRKTAEQRMAEHLWGEDPGSVDRRDDTFGNPDELESQELHEDPEYIDFDNQSTDPSFQAEGWDGSLSPEDETSYEYPYPPGDVPEAVDYTRGASRKQSGMDGSDNLAFCPGCGDRTAEYMGKGPHGHEYGCSDCHLNTTTSEAAHGDNIRPQQGH